jgi:oligopeptidase B
MDRENPEVLAHLQAENEFVAQALLPLQPLQDTLFNEIKNRIDETDISVPVRRGKWWYFDRTREGLNYPISCRVPATRDDDTIPVIDPTSTLKGEQVVLDENREAGDHPFLSVGVLAISPDDRWVAVGTDFDGDELHHLTIRPLLGQDPITDQLDDVYYGFTWANDSRHFFYSRVDDTMRPWQIWRHEIGTDPSSDALYFQEDDAQFTVSVGRSRDDAVIVIVANSSMTSEVHYVNASDPTAPLTMLEARRTGIEYGVEHFTDPSGQNWWLKVTNEGATDFRLLARPVSGDQWRELIPERSGNRLDGVDAFSSFLAISERNDGSAAVRLVAMQSGADPFGTDVIGRSTLVKTDVNPSSVWLSANPNFVTSQVRVTMSSLVTPLLVADVVVETGDVIVRKQQTVLGGYDAEKYVTGRLWVEASDGVRIPVSIVARRDAVHVALPALRLRQLRDIDRPVVLVVATVATRARRHFRHCPHSRWRRNGSVLVRDGSARPKTNYLQ